MKNDVLGLLSAARPDTLDPQPDQARRSRHLSNAYTQPVEQRSRVRRSVKRAGITVGVTTGLAGAAAVALFVSGAIPAATPARTPVTATPYKAASAQQILLTAANQSSKPAATSGRYWLLTGVDVHRVSASTGSTKYNMLFKSRGSEWMAQNPGDDNWSSYLSDIDVVPASPADEAIWKHLGSPKTFTVHTKGKPDYQFAPRPAKPFVSKNDKFGDPVRALGGTNVSVADMRAIPQDAAGLKAYLLRLFHKPGGTGGDIPTDENEWLFGNASSIISYPVSPATRKAAYQILAAIPGVRSLGTATDLNGRSGPAVSFTHKGSRGVGEPYGVTESRLIISPTTGLPLASELRQVSGGAVPAGSILSTDITEFAGYTNTGPAK